MTVEAPMGGAESAQPRVQDAVVAPHGASLDSAASSSAPLPTVPTEKHRLDPTRPRAMANGDRGINASVTPPGESQEPHVPVTFGPGKYSVTIGEDGQMVWEAAPPTFKQGETDARESDVPPEPQRLTATAIVKDPEVPGTYTLTTKFGTQVRYTQESARQAAVLDYLLDRPDEYVDRTPLDKILDNSSGGHQMSGLAKSVNNRTEAETVEVHYYGGGYGGTIKGMQYHSRIALIDPETREPLYVQEPESEENQPKDAIAPLGDPDLGVYVVFGGDKDRQKAVMLKQAPQREGLEMLRARPGEEVSVGDLEAKMGRKPVQIMQGLRARVNPNSGDELISEVRNDAGAVVAFRLNDVPRIASAAEAPTPEFVPELAPSAKEGVNFDFARVKTQMLELRPGPDAHPRIRMAWASAMANLDRAKETGALSESTHGDQYPFDHLGFAGDHSVVAKGVEEIFKAIESGAISDGQRFSTFDVNDYLPKKVSPPTRAAITSRLHALGFITAPAKSRGSTVDAKYIQRGE